MLKKIESKVKEAYHVALKTNDACDWKNYFDCCNQAVNQGSLLAIIGLSACYAKGIGVEKNCVMAMDLLHKAADDDDYAGAMYMLYAHYHNGIDVPKDEDKALKYLCMAADKGLLPAKITLGKYFVNGWYGIERNFQKAFELWEEVFRQGDNEAAIYLAQCYLYGVGTKRNKTLARKYAAIARKHASEFGLDGFIEWDK